MVNMKRFEIPCRSSSHFPWQQFNIKRLLGSTLPSFPPCLWRAGRLQLWLAVCRLLAPSNETITIIQRRSSIDSFYIKHPANQYELGGFTCKQLPYEEQCGLFRCPWYQLENKWESIGIVKNIFLAKVLPIVWGAAPSRNFTTAGWPNLQ